MKPAPVTSHWGIWCRQVGRGKTGPLRVWSHGVDNATCLSAGVPPLHLKWRLQKRSPLAAMPMVKASRLCQGEPIASKFGSSGLLRVYKKVGVTNQEYPGPKIVVSAVQNGTQNELKAALDVQNVRPQF